jgi:signal transduction histidine kinase
VVLLLSFPAGYLIWRLIPLSTSSNAANEIRWIVILLVFALLCGNIKESLFTVIYYIGVEACMDNIRNFLVRYTTGAGVIRFSTAYYVHMNLLYLTVLGWTIFYYVVLKNRRGTLPLHFWILTVIPPLGSMMLLTGFATEARLLLDTGINIYRQGLLFGFFLLALNFFTFLLYVRQLAFYETNLQTEVLQVQLNAQTRRITGLEAFQRQTGEMRHELKNLLFSLKIDMEQQNYDSAANRVSALLGDLQTAEPEHYTGIALIDAVISYKAAGIRERGADLAIQADLLDAIAVPIAYDIASLMAIALDNVLDAVEALPKGQTAGRAVRCTIQKLKNALAIDISNPLPGPLRYKNGELRSTKAEGGHGFGLSALRRITRKYGGELTVSDTAGTFTLSVLLYV